VYLDPGLNHLELLGRQAPFKNRAIFNRNSRLFTLLAHMNVPQMMATVVAKIDQNKYAVKHANRRHGNIS